MKKLLLFILVIQSIGSTAQNTNQKLDSLIQKKIIEYNIPSMAVSYITSEKCHYGIAGTTKTEGNQDVTIEDKYHLASNTKAITSLIAMKLVEDGKISLETTFIDVFPNLKKKISKDYYKITLGDLLSHKARIQPYTNGIEFLKLPEMKGTPSERRIAFAKFVLNEKTTPIGEYSNAGYAIASLMLEKVSGKSFEGLIAQCMQDLNFDHSIGFPNKTDENAPWGHYYEGDTQMSIPPDVEYGLEDYMLAAGDVSMKITDYSKLIQLHLNGLKGKNNYVSSSSYELMHYGIDNYAYGWINFERKGDKISTHDGTLGTFYSHVILDPKNDFAVVILMNAGNKDQVQGLYELRQEIIENMR